MNKNIKNKIIEHLSKHGNSPFGELVKSIDASYEDILETVLELKQKGVIQKKQDPPGYYSLNTLIQMK